MKRMLFQIVCSMPEEITSEFTSLIPKQHQMMQDYLVKGLINTFALAEDRETLWITMHADSELEVIERMYKFPLTQYLELNIQELAFQQVKIQPIPKFSLN